MEDETDRDGHKLSSTWVRLRAVSLITCYGVNRPAGRRPGVSILAPKKKEKNSSQRGAQVFFLFGENERARTTLSVKQPPLIKRTR